MRKTLKLVLSVFLVAAFFAGCAGQTDPTQLEASDSLATDQPIISEKPAVSSNAPKNSGSIHSGVNVADSYSAYLDAKNAVITKIVDSMSNNPDTGMAVLSFLGIGTIDLSVLPVSFFGAGQAAAKTGLSAIGATDVQYTENGGNYTITYSDEEDNKYNYSGKYDKAADALVCTTTVNGKESVYTEYRKTVFGYVGQYYCFNDDGTTTIYMIAVDGKDGTIGMSSTPGYPIALTGNESADFPKSCTEWYNVKGNVITGITSDGTNFNYEYTPFESAQD